jgi:signal transduction histidine kinase
MVPFYSLSRKVDAERLIFMILGVLFMLSGLYELFIPKVSAAELVLAYIAVGVGCIAAAFQYRRTCYFLSAFVLTCLMTFAAQFAMIYSYSDSWFGALWTTVILSQCFILLKVRPNSTKLSTWLSTGLSGAIISIGVIAWMGWFVDISSYYPWLLPNQMDLVISVSTILLGAGFLTLSGITAYQWVNDFPVWAFVASSVLVFMISISICIAQISEENGFLRTLTNEKANSSVSILKETLGVYELTLKNALHKMEKEGVDAKKVSEIDFIYSVIAPDELNKVLWVDPSDAGLNTSVHDLLLINTNDLVEKNTDNLIISLDLQVDELPAGAILSIFHAKKLFDRLFPDYFARDFSILVSKDGEVIYEISDDDYLYRSLLGSTKNFSMFNEPWKVEVWPTTQMVVRTQSVIAPTIFLAGAITSFLVGTTLYFFFIARNHANKVDRANKAKNAFLLNISHEVRTPLNGIIGTASLIANTELNPKQERFIQIIEKSGKLLLKIINDILDMSTIESGNLKLNRSEENLHQLITSTIFLFTEKANKKGIELILDYPRLSADLIYIDSVRFKQVLTNLIGNAMKFTNNGYVFVKVRIKPLNPDTGLLTVSVEDTGIGIDKKEHSHVFGNFNKVDQTYTKSHGGSGLGLSISKQLTEAMGGRLKVRSSAGEGSSFDLHLPVGWLSSRVDSHSCSADFLKGQSILVVSGDYKVKEVILSYVQDWEMVGCSASSIYDVIDMILEANIDLPPMYDYILIDGDSTEVKCTEIESLLTSKRIQNHSNFVVLTNMRQVSESDVSRNSFVNTVSKPLTAFELKNALENLKIRRLGTVTS